MAMQNVAAMMLGMQGSKAQSAANQNEQQGAPGAATAGASEGQPVLSDRASAFHQFAQQMGLGKKLKKGRGSLLGGLGSAAAGPAGTLLGGAQNAASTVKRFGFF